MPTSLRGFSSFCHVFRSLQQTRSSKHAVAYRLASLRDRTASYPIHKLAVMPRRVHFHASTPKGAEELYVTFIDQNNTSHKFAASTGDNLLGIAHAHDLEIEGACGGECACSTCHVIVTDKDFYGRMFKPGEDENDMLDMAADVTETSRLGCQVRMIPELDGLVVQLPKTASS